MVVVVVVVEEKRRGERERRMSGVVGGWQKGEKSGDSVTLPTEYGGPFFPYLFSYPRTKHNLDNLNAP